MCDSEDDDFDPPVGKRKRRTAVKSNTRAAARKKKRATAGKDQTGATVVKKKTGAAAGKKKTGAAAGKKKTAVHDEDFATGEDESMRRKDYRVAKILQDMHTIEVSPRSPSQHASHDRTVIGVDLDESTDTSPAKQLGQLGMSLL